KSGAREFCTGPISDKHAGGFSQRHKSKMHRYLAIKGGFLKVEVRRDDKANPSISFVHCAPDGKELNRITKPAAK
ncbi:MAG: alkaline phosphatase, partial [Phycisphaerales bacterium]|nr:alkaline phosphatase [Phycisphaerales bacterium]